MARVQRQRTLLKTSHTDQPHKTDRRVDWRTFFYVGPEERGVQAQPFLRAIAVPQHRMDLAINGTLREDLRVVVRRRFGVAPTGSHGRTDAVELVQHESFGSGQWSSTRARHWMRGWDGSVGFATPIESPHARGQISLRDVAVDCLRFMRLVADVLSGEAVEVRLEFQPADLSATPASLEPARREEIPLPDMPLAMRGHAQTVRPRIEVIESFTPAEIEAPFAKLAAMLHHHWRRIFNLPEFRVTPLEDSLESIAAAELGWARPHQPK